ncbi:hypothetical protein GCM10011391_13290 [Pullulanibacillus camelliae]|uniref:Uncharacterized protein n=1 Tax=Pullulanibacillus camelliae TaxID=1707096 RepID=A0A8J2YGG5_9BACL|nr:hypothetical protein [Pullulanibacillus camelliae]GGE35857.1 hypothetical protein GCM10011391_13290 [Pullulanibacillus camelliae]
MDKKIAEELDQIIAQDIESNDITAKDQWIMGLLATVPIIVATIWYFLSS